MRSDLWRPLKFLGAIVPPPQPDFRNSGEKSAILELGDSCSVCSDFWRFFEGLYLLSFLKSTNSIQEGVDV